MDILKKTNGANVPTDEKLAPYQSIYGNSLEYPHVLILYKGEFLCAKETVETALRE